MIRVDDIICMACHKKFSYRRGCCLGCYEVMRRAVNSKQTTWQTLESDGKCRQKRLCYRGKAGKRK